MKTKLKWKRHRNGALTCSLKLGQTFKVLNRQLKDLRKERDSDMADAARDFSNISDGDFDISEDADGHDVLMYAEGIVSSMRRAAAINYIIQDINERLEEKSNDD